MLRRLILVVGAAVLIDTTFLAVIAPLLPGLSHSLHVSKFGAGLLTAAYPAGMLVASLPGGVLAVRLGPRFAVCAGLALLVCSTVAFAFLRTAPTLDLARFIEGVGGALSWDGGVAWLVAAAPPDRRGTVIGRAVSAAIAGAVAGPALGAVAAAIGRQLLFCLVAALAAGLILVCAAMPSPPPAGPGAGRVRGPVAALLGLPLGKTAMWVMALPAIASGMLTVLGPLALHALGAGAGLIGLTFLLAALLETLVSAWVGGASDRHGRLAPLMLSFAGTGIALACFTLPHAVVLLILVVGAVSLGTGCAWTPAMALVADLSEQAGLDQALGAGLMNVAWAAGQIIGSAGGGGLAHAAGNLAPSALAAGLCLATALALSRPGRAYRRSARPGPGRVRRSSRTRG